MPTATYTPAYYGGYDPNRGLIPFNGVQPYVNPPAPVQVAQPAPVTPNVQTVQNPTVTAPTANMGATQPYVPAGTTATINGTQMTALGNGAWTQTNGNGWFDKGINANGQAIYGGATGYEWGSLGLNTAFGLFNAYQGYQAQKLAKAQFQDQRNLNHANYQMQAKAFNNNLRNQQSGRGYIGMSGSAKRALGAEYQTRKANDDY